MKNFKSFLMENNVIEFLTEEMIEFFFKRTFMHIDYVRQNGEKMIKHLNLTPEETEQFKTILRRHDETKLQAIERTPYILITWKYKVGNEEFEKLDIPEFMKPNMILASEHHVKNNKHHPEYWDDEHESGVINTQDRDKPAVLIDATKMPDVYVIEMACDWCAVSQERGTNPFDWADNNINVRWKFTDKQKKLIYDCLKVLYKKDENI
jgi:hypothetical protein